MGSNQGLRCRSRNASATSQGSLSSSGATATLPETKIFSVAVEQARKASTGASSSSNNSSMKVCDVDTSGSAGQFAVVCKGEDNDKQSSHHSANVSGQVYQPFSSCRPVPSFQESSRKSKKKSKFDDRGNSIGENPLKFDVVYSADSKELSPGAVLEEELANELIVSKPDASVAYKTRQSSKKASHENFSKVVKSSSVQVEKDDVDEDDIQLVDDSTHSDEFHEVRRTETTSEEEEEEENEEEASDFFIQDKTENASVHNRDSSKAPLLFSSAVKPSMPEWVNDLLQTSPKGGESLMEVTAPAKMWDNSTKFLPFEASTDQTESEDVFAFRPPLLPRSSESKSKKEGWSFEADDLDVDKLIEEVTKGDGEEKTPLEDVFKFDSELVAAAAAAEEICCTSVAPTLLPVDKSSIDDDQSENDDSSVDDNKMAASLNLERQSSHNCKQIMSASLGPSPSVGSTSESSVGSSPNTKKVRGKKKRKKKGF